MNSLTDSAVTALQLILALDAGLLAIVGRSLLVSATACALACSAGLVLGAGLGVARFAMRPVLLTLLNTMLAVPSVVVGLLVFAALAWTLTRTKIGLLIRAGVQDREMVESMGYRIRRLFVGVFVFGSALAGLGGVMWGLYQQSVTPQMGAQVNILIFIVIIIGGLGSTGGALIGSLLVGLMANYTGFLAPKVAMFSNIGLMVAILLWRPQGVFPVANR